MLKKFTVSLFVFIAFLTTLAAQERFQVLPHVADGYYPDGSYYRSTIMITPWISSDAPQCSLVFYGITPTLEGLGPQPVFSMNIVAGGFTVLRTTGNSAIQSGYATLTCSEYVFANVMFALHAPNNQKMGEATVFGGAEDFQLRLIADQRGGARLGLAIANNTDLQRTYRLSLKLSSGATIAHTFNVAARRNGIGFLDDIMSGSGGNLGILTIDTADFTNFSAIGLRFTGAVFTTIPAN